jgi:hypothetical protein
MTERDENGRFVPTGMNKMMLQALYNKPGARLMRRFLDSDAAMRKQREEEENNE